MDFDRGSLLPRFVEHSNAFSRTADEASSGDASLLLKAPPARGKASRMIGGDIVRAEVPPDRAGYRLSLKTWLKELEYGRVMLRASWLDKDGKKLTSIALEDMTETEAGWTVHEYAGLFETVGEDVSTIQVYAALDLSLIHI